MTYSEKLKDPRWQMKRLEVLNAAGWKCEDCGARDKTLHVHHCYYIRTQEPWDHGLDLLMSLCADCHEFRQGREEAIHVVLGQTLRRIGIEQLESAAWDMIHDAIKNSNPNPT